MNVGRTLIVLGLVLLGAGLLVTFAHRLPFKIGRLPGDFVVRGKNTTFYFPLATSVLLSVVATLIFWLFGRK
jgi:hypothetical protein